MPPGPLTASPESVYVREVGGVPTVAFTARNPAEVISLRKEAWFLGDLNTTRSHGEPLWDGKAPLAVRRATPDLAALCQPAAEAINRWIGRSIRLLPVVELDR